VSEVRVRQATALDSELLARLGRETFPGNFVGLAEPRGMAAYLIERFSPEVQTAELAEPGSKFFIAYSDTDAIGFAHLRSGNTPPEVTSDVTAEIHRMYVAESHWGRGAGRALMAACIEEAAARGCMSVWLGAWSENPRALSFYRSLGFTEVGTKTFVLGDETHIDLVMERDIRA
jgi:ribosomal protein S18 acetylase RimI-like enzyme